MVPSYRAVKTWVLVRRPLLLLLVIGCFVSIEASGRLSVRLILDGAVSFAFVPLVEIGSLALVARTRRVAFGMAVDLFFGSDVPWLLWIVAMIAFRAVESPLLAVAPPRPLFWAMVASILPVAVWTARLDLQLFRSVVAPGRPVRALIVQRAVAWTGALTYFFGIAAWSYVVGYAGL